MHASHRTGRLARLRERSSGDQEVPGSFPGLGMCSPDVVTGRGVGSRAAPVALKEERELSHKWEELKVCVGWWGIK